MVKYFHLSSLRSSTDFHVQTQHGCAVNPYVATVLRSFTLPIVISLTQRPGDAITITSIITPSVQVPLPKAAGSGPSNNSTNLGAIIGGAIGGFVALSATCFGIFLIWRKLKKEKTPDNADAAVPAMSDYIEGSNVHELETEQWKQPVEVEAKHGQSEVNAEPQRHELSAEEVL
jgi:hypothetical protein